MYNHLENLNCQLSNVLIFNKKAKYTEGSPKNCTGDFSRLNKSIRLLKSPVQDVLDE
jgi:hypothetical protein